jgi:hypothetical protein
LLINSDEYESIRYFNTLNRFQQRKFIENKISDELDNAKRELEETYGDKLLHSDFKSKENELESNIKQTIIAKYKIKPKEPKKYLDIEQMGCLIKLTIELSSFSEAKQDFCSQKNMNFNEDELYKALQVNDLNLSFHFNRLKSEVKLNPLKQFKILHVGTSNYLCKDKVNDFFTRLEKLVKLADSLNELSKLKHKGLQDEKMQPLKDFALEKSEKYINIGYKCNCWQPEASALKDAGFKNIEILKELNDDRITSDALKSFFYKVSKVRQEGVKQTLNSK